MVKNSQITLYLVKGLKSLTLRGNIMKHKLFETYYKLGFDHFVFKQLMHLKKPKRQAQQFYLGLIACIIILSMILG